MNLQENIQRIREMMISEEMVQSDAWKSIKQTLDILKKKKKVLLLSCSNRYNFDEKNIDIPKSKMIAMYLNDELGDKSVLIDVPELKILPCEGNVSRKEPLLKIRKRTHQETIDVGLILMNHQMNYGRYQKSYLSQTQLYFLVP
jgi:hypothetical protein